MFSYSVFVNCSGFHLKESYLQKGLATIKGLWKHASKLMLGLSSMYVSPVRWCDVKILLCWPETTKITNMKHGSSQSFIRSLVLGTS